MRTRWAVAVLFVVASLPNVGNAQVYQFATPPPTANASAAWWQVESAPIQVNGIVYVPTAFVRPFDGNVMTQVGRFDHVPVYADATLEPFSVLYVPVARGMRTYERQRTGKIAGTTGSRTPALPVAPVTAVVAPAPSVPAKPERTRVETVPMPRATDGVWIRYDGAKWYSDGEAAPYTPERFTQIGSYHGFPVYRERRSSATDIWVSVVQDGPVAPYAKR